MSNPSVLNPTAPGFAVFAQPGGAADFAHIRRMANTVVPFGAFVGVEVTEVDADHSVVEIPDRPELTNQFGTVHAGAQFLAADIAGACAFVGATASRIADVAWLVVRDSWSSFRRPARGLVRAVGTVDERAVRQVLAAGPGERVDLDGKAVLHDAAGTLVATFRFAYVAELAGPTGAPAAP
ncbi:PaaI family thioesterase [Frankia sp. QA3]|uniref:PaaI family thioesterase n=1 Tax=Frankia sp. QA3 TaxID=710111 RepID=UPI000269C1E3|nr:DUF4442 domain-containing protein [Frankia sp. QA3]EIV91667.1 uncharacterized protein, possibly involved in aromatic compounds catabolism [Frankia sp. QA3]